MKKKRILLYLLGIAYVVVMVSSVYLMWCFFDFIPDSHLITNTDCCFFWLGFFIGPALGTVLGFSGCLYWLSDELKKLKLEEKTGH